MNKKIKINAFSLKKENEFKYFAKRFNLQSVHGKEQTPKNLYKDNQFLANEAKLYEN